MGPQQAKSNSTECLEKQALIDSIRNAMDQILVLSQRELRAVSRHELQESRRIQSELKEAVQFSGSLLTTYNEHLRAHGCK